MFSFLLPSLNANIPKHSGSTLYLKKTKPNEHVNSGTAKELLHNYQLKKTVGSGYWQYWQHWR